MNGTRLKGLRRALGLTVRQFADLIDASPASVYRWEEHAATEIASSPHQERVLGLLDPRAPAVLRRVGDHTRLRGGLYGLYVLLQSEIGDIPKAHRIAREAPAPRGDAEVAP